MQSDNFTGVIFMVCEKSCPPIILSLDSLDMTSIDKSILVEAKKYIDRGDLNEIQHYWVSLQESEFEQQPDWVYLFQKVYLHACLKKYRGIASWLQNNIFPQLDPIQQIAVRQVFSYGNYLLNKK